MSSVEQTTLSAHAILKQQGVTQAERQLSRLCHRSFLSLWSYPGVFRDQGGGGEGKEVCDLLVVFGDDILIFSDKDCQFPRSQSLDLDWSRWFRRAVLKSAEQVWGAERWIRQFPNRLFLDRRCQRPLPLVIPDMMRVRFHRIVVAHAAAARCRELLGGSGSMMLLPPLKGKAHYEGPVRLEGSDQNPTSLLEQFKKKVQYEGDVLPFMIGDIDPAKGFVHVLDDTTLDVLMGALDTISDFVAYLVEKEAFARSGRLVFAGGEDDLLATYLQNPNEQGGYDFRLLEDSDKMIAIPEGEWESLQTTREWKARAEANRVSYFWDKVIEKFNGHILGGTSPAYPEHPFAVQELAVRALARENRFHRRVLSVALGDFLRKATSGWIAARVVLPIRAFSPHYVFLTVRPSDGDSQDKYRQKRRGIASAYALAVKAQYPDAREVVVIATAPVGSNESSEDLYYRRLSDITPEELATAKTIQKECGFLTKIGKPFHAHAWEYPPIPAKPPTPVGKGTLTARPTKPRSIRNTPCRCGSGKKTKNCCGMNRFY